MTKHLMNKKEFEKLLKDHPGETLSIVPIQAGRWQEYNYGATGENRMVHQAEVLEYPVEWRETARYGPNAGKPVGKLHKDGVRVKVNYRQFRADPTDEEEMIVQRKWVRGLWAPRQQELDEWEKKHAREQAEKSYYRALGDAIGAFYVEMEYPPKMGEYGYPSHDFSAEKEHTFTINLDRVREILAGYKVREQVIMPLEKWMLAYDKSGSTPKSVVMY